MRDNILEVQGLTKVFHNKQNVPLVAVNNVSLAIERSATYGLVGESGSGKSTLAKCLLGLYQEFEGSIYYQGRDLAPDYHSKKGPRNIQVVFQDPYSSLNPMLTIRQILFEPLQQELKINSQKFKDLIEHVMEQIHLDTKFLDHYPSELSGGQRQRVAIARAIINQPELIILDEPITALDVSLQSTIVTLLKEIQREMHISYLFISHDLEMVRLMSDDMGVMYHGQIIESGHPDSIYNHPEHEYTQELIAAIPKPDPSQSFLK